MKRVGLIGIGAAARHHAAAVEAAGAKVLAACARRADSPNWASLAAVAPEMRRLPGPQEVLDDPQIEVVVACLPWDVMPDWLERLTASPKPVLIEKPIGLTASATRDVLARRVGRRGLKMVGYNRRFYAPVARLRQRLSQGGLKAAEIVICEDIPSQIARHGEAIVENLLAFSSAHALDLALHLLGSVRPVAVTGQRGEREAGEFTSFNGLLETETKIPVALALNANDPSPAGIRCRFDDGTAWHLSPLEVLSVYRGTDVEPPTPDFNVRRYTPKRVERILATANLKPGFGEQMKAFLSGRPGPAATLEDGLRVLELIEALHAAAR
ncbi:MAG: Gfo/Idh/MocA family oxidoreductase [Alphaproteobacteria bacterium]